MLETFDKMGYEEWDKQGFVTPKDFLLDENNKLHEAIDVFTLPEGTTSLRL